MNSAHSSKSTVFTMNYAFFKWKTLFFSKTAVFTMNYALFFKKKTAVFTMNYTPCGWEPFWDLFGTGWGQWQSRAEPSRAEPSRPARAEPSRAEPEATHTSYFSKTSVFTMNSAFLYPLQKHQFLQWILLLCYKHISFYNEFDALIKKTNKTTQNMCVLQWIQHIFQKHQFLQYFFPFFREATCLFQKRQFLQWVMLSF